MFLQSPAAILDILLSLQQYPDCAGGGVGVGGGGGGLQSRRSADKSWEKTPPLALHSSEAAFVTVPSLQQ